MGKLCLGARLRVWARRLALAGALGLVAMPHSQISQGTSGDGVFGPYGPEGSRLREQLWIVPGADPTIPLRATVFRPPESPSVGSAQTTSKKLRPVRHPLVVINHGSDESTREAVAMPVFYWLSKWFVERGYVVLLPQRRGYGATGGALAEGRDTCADPDHHAAGLAAADDIEAALRYMARQTFVDRSHIVVVGVSTGGWASLALASRNPPGVRLVVNFAGGRGGHAYSRPGAICAPDRLIEAAGAYGRRAKVPTLWVYASNDSYFGPDIAASLASAWKHNGGRADLHLLSAYGSDGHDVVTDAAGWDLWGRRLAGLLSEVAENRRLHTVGR